MGPVNFVKGYGMVVNPVEEDEVSVSKRKASRRRRSFIAIAVSLAVFLTVIVAAVVGTLVHRSHSERGGGDSHPSPSSSSPSTSSSPPPPVSSNNSTALLAAVCAVTLHPDSCLSSMSPFPAPPKPDPEHFLNVSLRVAIDELANVSSLPKSLMSKVNERAARSALEDCDGLFDDAQSQLNESAGFMNSGPGNLTLALTPFQINSMQTWISAAMTDEDTCLNGLEDVNSTVIGEVKARVHKSNEYMSNTLAILNHLQSLHEKFGVLKH
ncbi:PREDICTED: pectinesterase 1 [Ipomoea nil]|uniref:pectinesterase 1 n=1 Tax=Ipomoea nil TaxID=35883 RepID=UPI000901F085|nr:PREDICTED: pectinesterase 1 [Ipomoea nil]